VLVLQEFEERLAAVQAESSVPSTHLQRPLNHIEKRCVMRALKKWRRYRYNTLRVSRTEFHICVRNSLRASESLRTHLVDDCLSAELFLERLFMIALLKLIYS
jgi:hypothetical protein